MKAIVRDDIIGLQSYVEAEFKYKKYIEIISECGGYCFINQIERFWKNEGGRYLVQKMEEAKLVKTDYFSKYKYLRLTANALKYLHYRNDERDFSGVPKNKISVQNLKTKPSEKVLFTSVLNFEYSQSADSNVYFLKKRQIELLEKALKINNSSEIEELDLKVNQLKEEYFKHEFTRLSQEENYKRIEQSNQEIINEVKLLEMEKLSLEEKNSFLRNYDDKIESIRNRISFLDKIIGSNDLYLRSINLLNTNMNNIAREHNLIEEEIEKLKDEQEDKNKSAEKFIKKISKMRDVSKIICLLDRGSHLHIFSTFVRYHKSNYLEILKNTVKLFREHNIEITIIKLYLITIFEPPQKLNLAMKKIEDNYSGSNIEFHWELFRTSHLEKYFDTVQDNIGYIKENHLEQFASLKDKLSRK